jgi:hypothetical protein
MNDILVTQFIWCLLGVIGLVLAMLCDKITHLRASYSLGLICMAIALGPISIVFTLGCAIYYFWGTSVLGLAIRKNTKRFFSWFFKLFSKEVIVVNK